MDQTSGTTPTDGASQAPAEGPAAGAPVDGPAETSGFGSRGRARRRIRFLRKARELAYRDLGGLVFSLHRFGQRNDELVLAKLSTLGQIDGELRALELALAERESVTVLREAGITACPRCAAIHSSEDRFCPHCGLSMARNVDLPIAGAAAASPAPPNPPPPATASAFAPSAKPAGAFSPAVAPTAASQQAPSRPVGPLGRSAAPPSAPATDRMAPVPPAGAPDGSRRDEATEIVRPPTPEP